MGTKMTNYLKIQTLTADQGWQTIDSEAYVGVTCPDIDLPSEIGYTDQLFRLQLQDESGATLDVSETVYGVQDPADRDKDAHDGD